MSKTNYQVEIHGQFNKVSIAVDELECGASDDEKGQMLQHQHNPDDQVQSVDEANVPLQSKQEDEM